MCKTSSEYRLSQHLAMSQAIDQFTFFCSFFQTLWLVFVKNDTNAHLFSFVCSFSVIYFFSLHVFGLYFLFSRWTASFKLKFFCSVLFFTENILVFSDSVQIWRSKQRKQNKSIDFVTVADIEMVRQTRCSIHIPFIYSCFCDVSARKCTSDYIFAAVANIVLDFRFREVQSHIGLFWPTLPIVQYYLLDHKLYCAIFSNLPRYFQSWLVLC